jgi:hypothetical protein
VVPFVPYTANARLLVHIPDEDITGGFLVIALRVHISTFEWGDSYPGLAASNLMLGQESALQEQKWLDAIGESALAWVAMLAGLALGIVALALFWAQKDHREYLWMFLQFFVLPLSIPIDAHEMFHTAPMVWNQVRMVFVFASDVFSILMYFAILRLPLARWMRIFLAVSVLGVAFFFVAVTREIFSVASGQVALLPLAFFSFGVLPVLLVVQWRRGNQEAPILLIPILLTGLTVYVQILVGVLQQIPATEAIAKHMATFLYTWRIGPFSVTAESICMLLYVLSLSIIIVLRSTRVSRRQAQMEAELEAAQQVQQVLVPDKMSDLPGFTIEAVYQPAEQVGGDFFQILPDGEGGLVLVVGDVAGKGLPAAMLVSALVGAIRGIAAYTKVPADILSNLNERLVGRAGGGFSTALVARVGADGSVAIANAGHLPPYLDGEEVNLPGALPLGVAAGVSYETSQFSMARGSRLTFYSDGVVEAQNQKGELFGFERGRALAMQPASVIADSARRFGQRDDITVVMIERQTAIAAKDGRLAEIPALQQPGLAQFAPGES